MLIILQQCLQLTDWKLAACDGSPLALALSVFAPTTMRPWSRCGSNVPPLDLPCPRWLLHLSGMIGENYSQILWIARLVKLFNSRFFGDLDPRSTMPPLRHRTLFF
jgi:hypothetical protein